MSFNDLYSSYTLNNRYASKYDNPRYQLAIKARKIENARKSKEKRQFIIKWLRYNNNAVLVKNEIVASVGKGKDNVAADVCAYIEKSGLDYTREENVHTGSFKALVKDEIQKGANVPLEELGVNRVVEATIKEVVK